MSAKRKVWVGRVYLGRDDAGKQRFWWCGRHPTKKARDAAVARARVEKPWEKKQAASMTCDELADRYVARYERLVDKRERKASSLDTVRQGLKAFRGEFGARPAVSIEPVEAEDWVETVPACAVPTVVSMFNYARRMRVVDFNPFEGLGGRGRARGRRRDNPPTLKEFGRLLDACDVLGEYGPRFRDLIEFAALTLLRPGELYELRHTDVDLVANRILVARRLYRQVVDVPKNGEAKTIALVPPAREILLRQPTRSRDDGLVFTGAAGRRLSAPTFSRYWGLVKEHAGLEFDFYLATKHKGVHDLYALGLSKRAIGAQAGWSEKTIDQMLAVYGHTDLVALSEVDALYANDPQEIGMRQ